MKHLFRKQAIILAALLQLFPIARNVLTSPAANSAFAIVLRWGVGAAATLGAYDAMAGATTPYFLNLNTNITMTVGVFYTNNIIVTNTQTDSGGYFALTNSAGQNSGQIGAGKTTTVCLPAGMTMKWVDTARTHASYAALYGTPTTVTPTTLVSLDAGCSGKGDIYTNIYFTVSAGGSPPVITNQPVNVTNVAGGGAAFAVVAGGTPPLDYQWLFDATNSLANETNTSLSITNIRAAQAGSYSVVITNAAGSVTSTPALLVVTVPPPPSIYPSVAAPTNGFFQFTFIPVPGLTNTVQTNTDLAAGIWAALTNLPPPPNTNAVTVTDIFSPGFRFYRVVVVP